VARDLPPASSLFDPHCCKAQVFGFRGIWHLSAPHDSLASRDNYDVPIHTEIFNLSIKRGDYEKARIDHSQNLLLGHELVQRIVTTKSSDHSLAIACGSL